jgi:geranylgeranylglycerol-phosphate geranylgeranyltransferase
VDTRSTIQQTSSQGTSNRLVTYLSMIRPVNCLMIGLAVVVGEVINLGHIPPLDKLTFGFLTASLMMGGTMILNDVYDIEIDRLNAPTRPLPSGRASLRGAWVLATVFSVGSIVSAVLLGFGSLLIAFLALILMVFYNVRGKRLGLLGNAVVSFNVALPFAFGGISVSSLHPSVLLFSMLAFLSNLGREVAKGIVDVQGDSLHGVKTLAVLKGPRVAALTSSGLFLAAVIVSFVPPFLGIVSVLYIPAVLIADFGFVFSSVRLISDSRPENARKEKNRVLLWMLLGLIAFLLGGFSIPVGSL